MKAIVYTAPNKVECREENKPNVPKGYVLLKTHMQEFVERI